MALATRLITLGGVLKRIGNFNPNLAEPSALASRIVFQKTIYFLQAFGMNLGYDFSWYIHGPYSPGLAKDGFEIAPRYEKFPIAMFVNHSDEIKFSKFIEFLGSNVTNPSWLEAASTLHWIKRMKPNLKKAQLFEEVSKMKPHLSDNSRLEEAYAQLSNFNLMG